MTTRISTKRKLFDLLDELDKLTRLCLETLANKDDDANPEIIMNLLFEKHQEYEIVKKEAEKQLEIQKKIDIMVENNQQLDCVIRDFQEHMKISESLLDTVLYYGRQKMDSIQQAIKHPLDPAEVVAYSHRLSANHGIMSPENWQAGDPRRPYPTDEEMRKGFLGHLNENGQFRATTLEALQESLIKWTPMSQANGQPSAVPVTSVFPMSSLSSTGGGGSGGSAVNTSPRTSHPASNSVVGGHYPSSASYTNLNASSTSVHAGSSNGPTGLTAVASSASPFMLPGVNAVSSPVILNSSSSNPVAGGSRSTAVAPAASATSTATNAHASNTAYGSTLHSLLSNAAASNSLLPSTYSNRSSSSTAGGGGSIGGGTASHNRPTISSVTLHHSLASGAVVAGASLSREEVDVISTDSSSSFSENES